jgi:hypothetical protein
VQRCSAHSSLTHEQRDAHGRTCVEFAVCLQKQSVASELHKLSLHLFCSSIAAACRFSAHTYALPLNINRLFVLF